MVKESKKPDEKPRPADAAAAFAQLLREHELAAQAGESWPAAEVDTAIRRLLRAHGRHPTAKKVAALLPRGPYWNAELGEFWLGVFLCEVRPMSCPAKILTAFQSQGWSAGFIANPLPAEPGDLPEDACDRLVNGVKYLNKVLPAGSLHFRTLDRGARVIWENAPSGRRRRRGRRA